jgi:hypothetical protein
MMARVSSSSRPALMRKVCALSPALALMLDSCDPVVSIAGANFPDWLICVTVGAALAAISRPILIWTGAERYLRPLIIFYSSMIALGGLVTWVIFFNRT